MKFTLSITLDNAEVEENGIDIVLPGYLLQVMKRVATGNADAGTVMDGNGNTIGKYIITDDEDEPDTDGLTVSDVANNSWSVGTRFRPV